MGDGRIEVIDDKRAHVYSSEGDRRYTVYLDTDKGLAYSDDNGTVYRNYVGYPILAFLMYKGVLPKDDRLVQALKGIRWRQLNERYKKYYIVERVVLNILKARGIDPETVKRYIDETYRELARINLYKLERLEIER